MKWFNNLKFIQKFVLAFFVVAAIMSFTTFQALQKISDMGELTQELYQNRLVPLVDINHLNQMFSEYRFLIFRHVGSEDIDEMAKVNKTILDHEQRIDTFLKKASNH